MTELMQAHHQWATRSPDERFTSLTALHASALDSRNRSMVAVKPNREIRFEPDPDHKGLTVVGETTRFAPTHWAFSQFAQMAGAPADYLREKLPAELAADNLNWCFQHGELKETSLLLQGTDNGPIVRSANGPNYGRVWDAEVSETLCRLFGDGVSGRWHKPGEFNRHGETVTKENTTFYRGEQDCFVFLCDGEKGSVEIKNRRNGSTGYMQRGFFLWNSEVGKRTLGLGGFFYDYMCCNHIVWGASGFSDIRIRHTSGAPHRWLEEIVPALETYTNSSTAGFAEAVATAQSKRLETAKVDDFLANRFGARMVARMKATHEAEESRPIENVFDVVTAATAVARQMPFIGPRVDLEREAGKLLVLA